MTLILVKPTLINSPVPSELPPHRTSFQQNYVSMEPRSHREFKISSHQLIHTLTKNELQYPEYVSIHSRLNILLISLNYRKLSVMKIDTYTGYQIRGVSRVLRPHINTQCIIFAAKNLVVSEVNVCT